MRASNQPLPVDDILAIKACALARDDLAQGETLFEAQCAPCHTIKAGLNGVGPSLADGRRWRDLGRFDQLRATFQARLKRLRAAQCAD